MDIDGGVEGCKFVPIIQEGCKLEGCKFVPIIQDDGALSHSGCVSVLGVLLLQE